MRLNDCLLILENSLDALVGTDEYGVIHTWNARAEKMFGWRAEEVIGLEVGKVLVPERHKELYAAQFRRLALVPDLPEGERRFRLQALRRDGSEVHVEVTAIPVREGFAPLRMYALVRDVTEAVMERERLKAIFEYTPKVAIETYDIDGKILRWNRAAEEMYGFSKAEAVGHDVGELILGPKDAQAFKDTLREVARSGNPVGPAECRIRRRDGSAGTVLYTLFAAPEPSGERTFICMDVDITERKAIEERFTLALDAAQMGVWAWDLKSGDITRSQNVDRLFGIERSGMRWTFDMFLARVLPEDRKRVEQASRKGSCGTGQFQLEFRVRRYDEQVRWLSSKGRAHCDVEGRPIRIYGVISDVTGRKQAEKRAQFLAQASEAFTSSLDYQATAERVVSMIVPQLADVCGIYGLDRDYTLKQLAIAHVQKEKLRTLSEVVSHYRYEPRSALGLSRVLNARKAILYPEFRADRHPGFEENPEYARAVLELGLESAMIVPLIARGKILGVIFIGSTGSGRRFEEADLRFAEELARRAASAIDNAQLYSEAQEAIHLRDEFISIASHELRTPLTPLRMQLQLVNRVLQSPELQKMPEARIFERIVQVSRQEMDRLSRLVNDLLDVSRISAGQFALSPERTDIGALVRDVLKRLKPQIQAAHCRIQLDIEPGTVGMLDRDRMDQVVANLLSNALKYGAGKPVQVSVRSEEGRAKLIVEDHGIGIAPQDQARIFDRFERAVSFRSFGGLGLGLYIVRQIVMAHGGSVCVESERGKGSTFTVDLPLSSEAKAVSGAA